VSALPLPRKILRGDGRAVARFGERWVVQTKGRWAGNLLGLEDWERSWLDELFIMYDDGERVYREALLGLARKNGKSTLGALIGLYGLLASSENSPEVYAAAASRDQARIVFQQAVDFIEASPKLRDWLRPQRNVILCPSNKGIFRVLASDGPLQYGLNPSTVIIDELWAHTNPELYYALTTGSMARQNPLIVSITTAGFDRQSICYSLYDRGQKIMRNGGVQEMRRQGFYFKWYEADPGLPVDDETTWKDANPSSWIHIPDLRREKDRLPESVFRRLFLNQWTETEDAWITPAMYDACLGKPALVLDQPTWIAVDVGIKRDSAAILIGQWKGDQLVSKQIILKPEDHPEMGVADVRGILAQECKKFKQLREVLYDPWSFRESAEMLLELGIPMVEFPQNAARMAPASENMYELIAEQRWVHDSDGDLREQVLNAVIAPTERGGWRISKRKSLARIDAAVSLAMMAARASEMRFFKPPSRGVTFY
jgi:phage terminase large subunit-like protein